MVFHHLFSTALVQSATGQCLVDWGRLWPFKHQIVLKIIPSSVRLRRTESTFLFTKSHPELYQTVHMVLKAFCSKLYVGSSALVSRSTQTLSFRWNVLCSVFCVLVHLCLVAHTHCHFSGMFWRLRLRCCSGFCRVKYKAPFLLHIHFDLISSICLLKSGDSCRYVVGTENLKTVTTSWLTVLIGKAFYSKTWSCLLQDVPKVSEEDVSWTLQEAKWTCGSRS